MIPALALQSPGGTTVSSLFGAIPFLSNPSGFFFPLLSGRPFVAQAARVCRGWRSFGLSLVEVNA